MKQKLNPHTKMRVQLYNQPSIYPTKRQTSLSGALFQDNKGNPCTHAVTSCHWPECWPSGQAGLLLCACNQR